MSSPPISLEDYDAIANAVMETERGRWFLAEYARRNRSSDTQAVLDALQALEQRLAAGGATQIASASTGDAVAAIGAAMGAARNIRTLLYAVPKQGKVVRRSLELADEVELELGRALAALGEPGGVQAALPAPDPSENSRLEPRDETRGTDAGRAMPDPEPDAAVAALAETALAEPAPDETALVETAPAETAGAAEEPLSPAAIEAAVEEMARAMPQADADAQAERAGPGEPSLEDAALVDVEDDASAHDPWADEEIVAVEAGAQASAADERESDPSPDAEQPAADGDAYGEAAAEPAEASEPVPAEVAAIEAPDAPPVAPEESEPAPDDQPTPALRDEPDVAPFDEKPTAAPEPRPALALAVVETRQDAELQDFAAQVAGFAQSYAQQPFRRTLPTSRAPSLLDSLSESEKAILFA